MPLFLPTSLSCPIIPSSAPSTSPHLHRSLTRPIGPSPHLHRSLSHSIILSSAPSPSSQCCCPLPGSHQGCRHLWCQGGSPKPCGPGRPHPWLGRRGIAAAFPYPTVAAGDFFHPWPFLFFFPLPLLWLLHRFASTVDGKKGNGAKLLPGTTGSRAPAIQPCSAGLAASRAGFLCSLCEPFLPAVDIGFPAQGHFQGCKSALLLYLVFLFSLPGFQTCWRSRLLCTAPVSPSPPWLPQRTLGVRAWVGRSLPSWRRQWAMEGQDLAQGWDAGGTPVPPACYCGWDESPGRALWVLCCPHRRSRPLGHPRRVSRLGSSTLGCLPRVWGRGKGRLLLYVKRSPFTLKIHVLLLAGLRHLLPRATVLHIKAKLN